MMEIFILDVNHSKKKPRFSTIEGVSDFHIYSSAKLLEKKLCNSWILLQNFYHMLIPKKKTTMTQNCLILYVGSRRT